MVENGAEVLEEVFLGHYDAVLMDVQMPEMDGYEATAKIREREGVARHTPVIAMTANALEGEREAALSAGMDDYVAKPAKAEELDRVLMGATRVHEVCAELESAGEFGNLAAVPRLLERLEAELSLARPALEAETTRGPDAPA